MITIREFIEFFISFIFTNKGILFLMLMLIAIYVCNLKFFETYEIIITLIKLILYGFLLRLFYIQYGLDKKVDAVTMFTILLTFLEVISGLFNTIVLVVNNSKSEESDKK